MKIAIDKIKASPFQPRLEFDLEDLKGSILKDGILVPLTVRKSNEDHYELIDGERRLRLAKELDYKDLPCEVLDVDDETADRMVWKVNTLRKDYKPKEKASHFRLHQRQGMSAKGIASDHDERYSTVIACLNVFKLPRKYQNRVWDGPLSLRHIEVLGSLLNGGEVTAVTLKRLDETIERRLSHRELHEILKPQKEEDVKQRVEAAKKAILVIKSEVKIKTPEDYDRAAKILQKEAKKKREAAMTEKEKAAIRVEKEKKAEEIKHRQEEKKQAKEEQIEKKAIEEAKKLKKKELIKDKEFVKEVYKEHRELESEKLVKQLEGSRVKDISEKPEIFFRIEVRQWIAQLQGVLAKIQGFRLDKLTSDERKATLEIYMLISHELKKIFK